MKIATYNLRFGGGKKNRKHWMDILEVVQPDIFLAQETCDPRLYLDNDFYECNRERIVWQAVEERPWGSALYFTRGVVEPITIPGFEGWVAGAQVKGFGYPTRRDRPLRVFSVHAPRPEKSSYHKEVNKVLDSIIETYDNDYDLVIGGDFNLSVSVSSSEQPYLWAANDWRTRLKRELGLINCWQAANPNCELPQTLRWSGNPSYPYHCDGIFAPASWYRYLESSEVFVKGWESMSDHNPVTATFEVIGEDLTNPGLSVEDYQRALVGIKKTLTAGQWAMLEAQYHAPKQTITAMQLAGAAGYRSYHGANLQYAMVGQKIADFLHYTPVEHAGSRQPFWSSVLADGYWSANPDTESGNGKTWYWVLRAELAQAMKALGWV